MRSLIKKTPAACALLAAVLCASTMYATGTGARTGRGGGLFYRLTDLTRVEGFDVERRDGRVVGLRALRQDGSWLDLRPKPDGASYAAYCPEGQTAVCWEDDIQQMTVCSCTTLGGDFAPEVLI